jgi:hypothetical protein
MMAAAVPIPVRNLFSCIWMLRQSCRESIFSCHGRIKADIQVLEVDTGYKIRYNEAADIGQSQVRKGRKMHEVEQCWVDWVVTPVESGAYRPIMMSDWKEFQPRYSIQWFLNCQWLGRVSQVRNSDVVIQFADWGLGKISASTAEVENVPVGVVRLEDLRRGKYGLPRRWCKVVHHFYKSQVGRPLLTSLQIWTGDWSPKHDFKLIARDFERTTSPRTSWD